MTSIATPPELPAVGALEPRRLGRYVGRGGVPLDPGLRLLFGLPSAAMGAYLLTIALRQFAGERVPGAHAPPAVILAVAQLFAAIGAWFVVGALAELAWRARAARRRARFPGQLWLADYPWERRGGRDRTPAELWRAIALVGLLAGWAATFSWAGFVRHEGVMFMLAGAILVAATLAAARRAGRVAWRLARWGPSRLRFADFPCAPGGTVEAIFDDLAPAARTQLLHVTLRCVQERWETADTSRDRTTRLVHWELWQESMTVAPGVRSARFPLPAAAPSSALAARPARWWEIDIVAATRDVDYRACFLVPVYAG